jgi:hypothetical protein
MKMVERQRRMAEGLSNSHEQDISRAREDVNRAAAELTRIRQEIFFGVVNSESS